MRSRLQLSARVVLLALAAATFEDVLAEFGRRSSLFDSCFDKQRAPILHPSRQKAIITSRRAGKTNTVLRDICIDASENPHSKYAYLALTGDSAVNIVWKELIFINDEHNLGLHLLRDSLLARFPNGAELTLYGVNDVRWLNRFRGAKYRRIVIDEAGEYTINLRDFILQIIRPTLTDQLGTLWLIGTPGHILSGYWYDITRPEEELREPGWMTFQWNIVDNPHIAKQWDIELSQMLSDYGTSLYTMPWFIREWMGQWCVDTTDNVYLFDPAKNTTDAYTRSPSDRFILGVDPGYSDAAGFAVASYSDLHDSIVYVDAFHQKGMLMDAIAGKIEEYRAAYPGIRILGDPASLRIMSELRERYHIPIENAEKDKKQQAIRVMNNDFARGKIKLKLPECQDYAEEISDLKKRHKKSGEWEEHERQPNDICDAALYAHRACYHYRFKPPVVRAERESPAYYAEVADKLKRQAIARLKRQDRPWWD